MLVLQSDVGPISLDLAQSVTVDESARITKKEEPVVHSRKNEKEELIKVLELCQQNRAKAAEMLGISTVTLWRKLKKHGLIN